MTRELTERLIQGHENDDDSLTNSSDAGSCSSSNTEGHRGLECVDYGDSAPMTKSSAGEHESRGESDDQDVLDSEVTRVELDGDRLGQTRDLVDLPVFNKRNCWKCATFILIGSIFALLLLCAAFLYLHYKGAVSPAWIAILAGYLEGSLIKYNFPCDISMGACVYNFDDNSPLEISFDGTGNLTNSHGKPLGLPWEWKSSHVVAISHLPGGFNEILSVDGGPSQGLQVLANNHRSPAPSIAPKVSNSTFTVLENNNIFCELDPDNDKKCPAEGDVAADALFLVVGNHGGTISVNGAPPAVNASFSSGSNLTTHVQFYSAEKTIVGNLVLYSALRQLCNIRGINVNNIAFIKPIMDGGFCSSNNIRIYTNATVDCGNSQTSITCSSSEPGTTETKALLYFSELDESIHCTAGTANLRLSVPNIQPTVSTFAVTENGDNLCNENLIASLSCPTTESVAADSVIAITNKNNGTISVNGSAKTSSAQFNTGSLSVTQVELFDSRGTQLRQIAMTSSARQLCTVTGIDSSGAAISTAVMDRGTYVLNSVRIYSGATIDCTNSGATITCSSVQPGSTATKALLLFSALSELIHCTAGTASVGFSVPTAQPTVSTFAVTENAANLCSENLGAGSTCPTSESVAADSTIAVTSKEGGLISINESTKTSSAQFNAGSLSVTQVGLFDSQGTQLRQIAMTSAARQLCTVTGTDASGAAIKTAVVDRGTYSWAESNMQESSIFSVDCSMSHTTIYCKDTSMGAKLELKVWSIIPWSDQCTAGTAGLSFTA